MINPSYHGNSVGNNSFNGVNLSLLRCIVFFCHFTSFLILSMIIGKPFRNIKRGVFCVYCIVSEALYPVNISWLSMRKFAPLLPLVSWWVADVCQQSPNDIIQRLKRYWQYPNHNKIIANLYNICFATPRKTVFSAADQEWRPSRSVFARFVGFDSTWFYFKFSWLVR